jgi:small subunit ribosomal protein S7
MTRSGKIKVRKIKGDAVYSSILVHRFINKLMLRGKKSKAEKILYISMETASKKLKKQPMEVFEAVIKNVAPLMEVKARRVGGATYQIPIEVSRERGIALAMKWLRDAARSRPGRSMAEKLSSELVEAFSGGGGAMKMREDMHKTAEANKAFAHFRW